MKTAFIGHRQVFAKNFCARLADAIRTEIRNGCTSFTMGTHGEFDNFALDACRNLRSIYPEMEIEVVLTSLHAIKKEGGFGVAPYSDLKTVMYEVEGAHYKRRITLSNKQMIDSCDTLICYVDTSVNRSGAKAILRYAERKKLKIVNLYRKEDQPFYGMDKEQIEEYWEKLSGRVLEKK